MTQGGEDDESGEETRTAVCTREDDAVTEMNSGEYISGLRSGGIGLKIGHQVCVLNCTDYRGGGFCNKSSGKFRGY